MVESYMNDIVSVGDYCDKIGISRHQFNQIIDRYKKLFPRKNMDRIIKNRTRKVQSEKLKRIAEEKSLFLLRILCCLMISDSIPRYFFCNVFVVKSFGTGTTSILVME